MVSPYSYICLSCILKPVLIKYIYLDNHMPPINGYELRNNASDREEIPDIHHIHCIQCLLFIIHHVHFSTLNIAILNCAYLCCWQIHVYIYIYIVIIAMGFVCLLFIFHIITISSKYSVYYLFSL